MKPRTQAPAVFELPDAQTLGGAARKLEMAKLIGATIYDPVTFVQAAYPWRKVGTSLEYHDGPDTWQMDFLVRLRDHVQARAFDGHTPVMPIRMAVSKGHGVGGSALAAWLVDWIMSTRPNAQGTVTANTCTAAPDEDLGGRAAVDEALSDRRPSSRSTWTGCITSAMDSWFCTPQTCKEQNSEAFAGQHAADSTSFYINDEDS